MEIHYLWPINHLALNSQTFEVIFRNTTNGKYHWFISQEFQGNSIVSTLEDMGTSGSYKMLNQNEEHSRLNVYPNPVNSKLTISNTVIIERIYIFDLQGRLLMSKEPKEKQVEIDVADLAEGVYLINVKDHIGDHTLKFKKQ